MAESTAHAPVATPSPAPAARRDRARETPRTYIWWAGGAAIVALSAAIVYWARTRPGFDPYGWLVWGRQTLAGNLDTNAAPSWKPLPYIFTVPYALAGRHQLHLWMITAVAVSLSGSVFAGRIAYRLTRRTSGTARWPAAAAGVLAGLALIGIDDYVHYILSAQSDPMIVALCLGAIDLHLSDRPRAAFVLALLAGLGRPEAWAFEALYGLWLWLRVPSSRPLVAGGAVLTALLWFGIPALTSRTPFVSAANAYHSGRRLTHDQIGGTIGRFLGLSELPIELAALVAIALAALRRDRTPLALAGLAVAWLVIECAFALHGWPANPRYMFEAAGVVAVLCGIAAGYLLSGGRGVSAWAGALLAAVLVGSLVPGALSRVRTERRDLREQHVRTAEINALSPIVARIGGAAVVRRCGEPLTRLEYQSMLAWTLGENVSRIGFKYGQAIAHGNPIVMFTPFPHGVGWVVGAMHQVLPACRALPRAL